MLEPLGDNEDAPTYLVPKMGEFAVSNTAFYTSLYITDIEPPKTKLEADPRTELAEPLDPFAKTAESGADASTPAIGVLLTHEQGWFQEGLALGTLLHSLCLAPGEVTKVAIVDWQRRAAAIDAQATDQSEEVSSESNQALSTNEVQRAQARELQFGQSSSSSVSTQSNIGGSAGFLGMGISGSSSLATSHAHSASMSTGQRDLSARIQPRCQSAHRTAKPGHPVAPFNPGARGAGRRDRECHHPRCCELQPDARADSAVLRSAAGLCA
uniref:Uncharacterized protein n=1 Tax=Yoonia rhodophyticola TaxID=3137370 RepID=A0AAN0NJ01_9RHOB